MSESRKKKTGEIVFRKTRPIDKQIHAVTFTYTTTQVNRLLFTAAFPGTLFGIRWDLSAQGNENGQLSWVLSTLKDGDSIQTISQADQSLFFRPAERCIASGTQHITTGTSENWSGSSKTQRKLGLNDQFIFSVIADFLDAGTIRGHITFFIKS